jgi:hypothetical protein
LRDSTNAASGAVASKTPVLRETTPPDGPSAEKLLDRARQAEASGKRQLALAYLRVARDQGSAPAQKEINRLSQTLR